jgi:hypothetical protein
MFRRVALGLCLGLTPLLLSPLPVPVAPRIAQAPPATPDLVAAWLRLWGEPVGFDDTWLLRAAPGSAQDESVVNCNGRSARLQVVAEQRLTVPGPKDDLPGNFVDELERGGFSTFAVGAIIETPRGRAGIVGLDIRDAETSFLMPYVAVEEADLTEVTGIVAAGLQRRGSAPPRGSALAAFR